MTDHASAVLRRGSAVLVRRGESLGLPTAAIDDPDTEDEPAATARSVLREQFDIADDLTHVRTGSAVRKGDDAYYPVLFDDDASAADEDAAPSDAPDDAECLSPTALLHEPSDAGTWQRYERVAPTVRSVAADDEHGAASLSVRALEVLRDRAALQVSEEEPDWGELADLGTRLLRARPSMAVLENRVNRVLDAAWSSDASDAESQPRRDADPSDSESVAVAVEAAADAGIDRALRADADAADEAAATLDGASVLTLSRSGTVLSALSSASPRAVFVAESRPAREGVAVAETLADRLDAPITVHADAAVAHALATEDVDAVVVGADAVLPDGRVVNKTGTRAAALAAAREDIPVYVAAASDKITHRETVNLETGDATAIYDGPAALDVLNPTFDVTPADLIEAVLTERGALAREGIADVAAEHEALTEWRE
jgi:translation initiation factor 2B subunit (eIF-2B alpha/beta/delta family)